MSSPHRHSSDPFETLVELTAAAMRGRPPRDFVYGPAGPSVATRIADFLQRVPTPKVDPGLEAANEPSAEVLRALQRYY